ncbi:AEL233Cp [Eremothecium gossypii ATCC 10895]|uniref:AEL233Cp n=1 Tax=Eremothecium gossypii (strain ATCC 10895 / CBS 109.51 / FGSC 9923 / NRRL Y-1056) TaxID=284811 RepID=Q758J5_EREGS|nr:AEL233Cp [Eremothecium gossypii ATCC 10895]AAS52452.2 AEL233Cp [Eremothecium gossypii ATCC 10895]
MLNFDYPQKDWYKDVRLCGCRQCCEAVRRKRQGSSGSCGMGEHGQYLDEGYEGRGEHVRSSSAHSGSGGHFVPTISFDTVPIQGISPEEDEQDALHEHQRAYGTSLDYTLEEYYNNEDTSYNHDYRSGGGYAGELSPLRSLSPSRYGSGAQLAKFDVLPDGRRVRIDYPSKSTLLSDSFVLNKTHREWRSKWKARKAQIERRKLEEPQRWYRYPSILFPETKVDLSDLPMINDEGVAYNSNQRANMKRIARVVRTPVGFPVSPRIVLCHVSGRKHTWAAVDWVLQNFIADSDHLVVVANLPRLMSRFGYMSRSVSRSRSRSRSRSVRRTTGLNSTSSFGSDVSESMTKNKDEEWCNGYTVGSIETILDHLIEYITFIIPEKLAIKVTVEVMIGKTRQVLIEALNLHCPDLLVASTTKYKENDGLLDHRSKRLTTVLANYYPLPVFVVPAKRMFLLGMQLESIVHGSDACNAAAPVSQQFSSEVGDSLAPFKPSLKTMHTSPAVMLHTESSVPEVEYGMDESEITSIDSELSDGVTEYAGTELLQQDPVGRVARMRETYRRRVQKTFSKIDSDSTLQADERHFNKLDAVINASLKFNKELENSKSPSILELQRIITGGEKHTGFRKKSMLDVLDLPSAKPRKQDPIPKPNLSAGDPTPRRTTRIKFEATVKDVDGSTAVQQSPSDEVLREMSPLRQVQSLSQSNLMKYVSNNSLRKVRSANTNPVNSTKYNESTGSSGKRKRGGFLSALFGGSGGGSASNTASPATSRRSSMSSSENSGGTSTGKRKKKWKLLK